jgi:hypothetical protein
MELRAGNRWALVQRIEGKRPQSVKTFANMGQCERALNQAVWGQSA